MEDPSKEEWEVEDYSTSYESNENLGWIWRKGLSLGKKVAIAGVVITSTPLVLPPLVALSTVGFALSVPVGFPFVAYACSEKAVNSLLPPPPSHPLLEKGAMSNDDEADWINRDGGAEWYQEDEDVEAEGREFGEDRSKEIGTKDELGNGNDQADNYGVISTKKDELNAGTKLNEIAEENVYEEDVIECMEQDEETLSADAIPDILEGIREAEDEISSRKRDSDEFSTNSLQAVVVAANVGGEYGNKVLDEMAYLAPSYSKEENRHESKSTDIDEKETGKDTTGLIEKIRDKGEHDPARQDRPVQRAHKGRDGSEGSLASDTSQNKGNRNIVAVPGDVKLAHDGREGTYGFTSEANSSTLGNAGTRKKVNKKKSKRDKSGSIQEEPKLVAEKRLEVHGKTHGRQTMADIRQGASSDRKRGNLNPSNSDEIGSHLVHHGTVVPERILNFPLKAPEGISLLLTL